MSVFLDRCIHTNLTNAFTYFVHLVHYISCNQIVLLIVFLKVCLMKRVKATLQVQKYLFVSKHFIILSKNFAKNEVCKQMLNKYIIRNFHIE